jgi:exodeoxyribonuclease-1
MSEKSETYFYFDLETSGLSPVNDRIMQFAGVRTDLQYMQIGKPINFYVKLPPDILPSPEAVLVTGITPQKTLEEGVSSPEFSRILNEEIAQPRTTYVTYNGITFDIPHVDNTNYRNLHPPYDWRRSGTADILNEIRPQAALRPDGMEWAINEDGLMSFRLEDLTEANEISHELKHDAMGDVMGLIELDKKRYTAQPRLVNYQKRLRDKKNIQEFLQSNPEYIYVDRSIPKEFRHGTVCTTLATLDSSTFITYDLRHDPSDYMSMSETELLEALRPSREKYGSIPVKTFKSNKQPQIFPMVIFSDSAVQERLMLTKLQPN